MNELFGSELPINVIIMILYSRYNNNVQGLSLQCAMSFFFNLKNGLP